MRQTVNIGGVKIGGTNKPVVQSMILTPTYDIEGATNEIIAHYTAGSSIVRLTVDSIESAKALPRIKERLLSKDCDVPLVGDFHYNGHKLLKIEPYAGHALAKLRINPGTLGTKRDENFERFINFAISNDKVIRIGANWGSLDKKMLAKCNRELGNYSPLAIMEQAVVQSAIESAQFAESMGLDRSKIVLSCKVSNVNSLVKVYRKLTHKVDHALHLGLTEAGMGTKGIVNSTAALAILLNEGIGDTIRISVTPTDFDRVQEIVIAQDILQSLGLVSYRPQITACPGCGRTSSENYKKLAAKIDDLVNNNMPRWKILYPGVEEVNIAVMGCIVNGPGESKIADIGISLPGDGEEPKCPVYIEGKLVRTLEGLELFDDFIKILENYLLQKFSRISAITI
ncbi:4-hydroxy-3-methylbut-2-en-1-yl diphosphate synthase [Vibrio nigripulchritudo SFn27]|uniref:4-hydroxy-3-methylbut-2-en-1-yl diphosphate synthase (flavodoxin) n=1 Tax=Vibrio nigripulchritudo TaxID=28173 RepID=A0A9P1JLF6_9VIBR|nr:flavodoxin-dependent (E)-4-hydroxy-3-methylbut-2-enyl-diphosphate synthase [Vibrio nigripulchritudo]CBJ93121.1 4-hydroxy-3-methylbut-2-en-1-yl diphosphate synthase [Vibrio nigripulchritudo]CCN85936.1 4-hydroxy-3-methylbut-2-en-1-yl diphosphate synthase [Vibrio nigripulchritudo BLFn1]CCN91933.1 4-hydroxy-3-methylbut-2-en-1-yl diphosphate synthase [Vibrio nigripulchritudo SFn27]CCN97733.1 4-hydroxy-3-methylbut-2-en-1-yl diphosphate synthase [Vibrio nigripulchritudo ENn2]CCO43967.1 4-hydroxy-3